MFAFRLPSDTQIALEAAINSHMYFTTRAPQTNYSTLGWGFIAGGCDAKLYHHVLIMEYQYDDITFARVSNSPQYI